MRREASHKKHRNTKGEIRNGARSTALSLTVLLLDSRTGTGACPDG